MSQTPRTARVIFEIGVSEKDMNDINLIFERMLDHITNCDVEITDMEIVEEPFYVDDE